MLRRLSSGYLLFLYLSDAVLVITALLMASWLRITLELGASGKPEAFGTPPALFAFASLIWLSSFHVAKVYSPPQRGLFWRELQRVIAGHGLACLLFFGVLYITYRDYSRLQATYFIALLFIGVVLHRIVLRMGYRLVGGRADARHTIVIVGTDTNAQRTGETVARYAWAGLRLVGYVQRRRSDPIVPELNRAVLGITDDLPALIEQHNVGEVIIAVDWPDTGYPEQVISLLRDHVVNIRLAPDYSELAYFHVSVETLGGIPLIGLREEVLSASQRLLKRLFDMAASAMVLCFGWPLMLFIGLLVWVDSRGPVIIRQKRAGEHGRLFTMYKFRTMIFSESEPEILKQPGDSRVTRIGRVLRRTSLDEMPQFVNVLRGDMSLVGPRPEMPWLIDQYEPWQRKRFEVPQGLTGWWQINGRADRPMHLNTEDDLFYIRHYSLWLDLQIIFRTILVVIMGRGAY